MDKQLQQDELGLNELLDRAKQFAIGFRADDERPAGATLRETPAFGLPDLGGGAQDAMRVFEEQWQDYFVASPSNRYLGYVTGGTTPAALVGDWLTSALDPNPQAVKGFGDVSAALEVATIGMLRELFALAQRLNDRGHYFLTTTTLFGRRGLRAAFVNWQCQTSQVEDLMEELHFALEEITPAPATAPP